MFDFTQRSTRECENLNPFQAVGFQANNSAYTAPPPPHVGLQRPAVVAGSLELVIRREGARQLRVQLSGQRVFDHDVVNTRG